jgi:hypothetical protein
MFNNISPALRQGIFFGANSGIITTLGLISGITQSTNNYIVVIVSVVSLAISDSVSEAYGLYISKKAEKLDDNSSSPMISFLGVLGMKFVIVMSFLIPFLFSKNLKYFKNLVWPLGWGIILLTILACQLAKMRNEKKEDYIFKHIIIVAIVVILARYFGKKISQ